MGMQPRLEKPTPNPISQRHKVPAPSPKRLTTAIGNQCVFSGRGFAYRYSVAREILRVLQISAAVCACRCRGSVAAGSSQEKGPAGRRLDPGREQR